MMPFNHPNPKEFVPYRRTEGISTRESFQAICPLDGLKAVLTTQLTKRPFHGLFGERLQCVTSGCSLFQCSDGKLSSFGKPTIGLKLDCRIISACSEPKVSIEGARFKRRRVRERTVAKRHV